MNHAACESKLHVRSVVKSSMHPCPGNGMAIGRAVVHYLWAAHIFSAGMSALYQMGLFELPLFTLSELST